MIYSGEPQVHNPQSSLPLVLVITGPTGVGKTALSAEIAGRRPVEIISADSRQIYRFMDIGTAKPPAELRRDIPHHFIDILDPDQPYNASDFGTAARQVVLSVLQRGKIPLVVGGSGLYIRSLLTGFFRGNAGDPQIRAGLEERLAAEGAQVLMAELQRLDPVSAARLHPNNHRRIVRALEVCYATGKPLSLLQQEHPDPAPFRWVKFALFCERPLLYRRINRRVEKMFEQGLVAEVQALLQRGYSPQLNALNSVGYREVIACLRGEMSLQDCRELVKRNSRRFAKRQLTWLRAEDDVSWMDAGAASAEKLAERIIRAYDNAGGIR